MFSRKVKARFVIAALRTIPGCRMSPDRFTYPEEHAAGCRLSSLFQNPNWGKWTIQHCGQKVPEDGFCSPWQELLVRTKYLGSLSLFSPELLFCSFNHDCLNIYFLAFWSLLLALYNINKNIVYDFREMFWKESGAFFWFSSSYQPKWRYNGWSSSSYIGLWGESHMLRITELQDGRNLGPWWFCEVQVVF